ncbi:MAG: NIL domain-containing protein [Candidatus Omnitrophota bacterium]
MIIRGEFVFPERLKDEPLICNICKDFNIVLKIVEASFSTNTGWAILIFEGEEYDLKKAIAYLKSKGVETRGIQL